VLVDLMGREIDGLLTDQPAGELGDVLDDLRFVVVEIPVEAVLEVDPSEKTIVAARGLVRIVAVCACSVIDQGLKPFVRAGPLRWR
jgi:hypothetical protein